MSPVYSLSPSPVDTSAVDLTEEVWRPIPSLPGYEASNVGRVRSIDRFVERTNGRSQFCAGTVRKPRPNQFGYLYIRAASANNRDQAKHGTHRTAGKQARGDRCGRGHLVTIAVNVIASELTKRGVTRCLSCKRGESNYRRALNGGFAEGDLQMYSDRHYRSILEQVATGAIEAA